jgi:hypothetical protein
MGLRAAPRGAPAAGARGAAVATVRSGWAEAAQRLRARGEDRLLDAPSSTRFDEKEWAW